MKIINSFINNLLSKFTIISNLELKLDELESKIALVENSSATDLDKLDFRITALDNFYTIEIPKLNSRIVSLEEISKAELDKLEQIRITIPNLETELDKLDFRVTSLEKTSAIELDRLNQTHIVENIPRYKIVDIVGESIPGRIIMDVALYDKDNNHLTHSPTKRISMKINPKIRHTVNRILSGSHTEEDFRTLELCLLSNEL